MATERSHDPQSVVPDETTVAQGDVSATVHVPNNRVWYRYLSEDWFATLVGVLLVILIVAGLLHAIP